MVFAGALLAGRGFHDERLQQAVGGDGWYQLRKAFLCAGLAVIVFFLLFVMVVTSLLGS
jgi:hypothetical protein